MNIGTDLYELVGMLVGLALTLAVFSYVLGDNALFRVSIYLFIGVASGAAAVIAFYNVLLPHLVMPLMNGDPTDKLLALVPLLLSGLMLLKISPRLARLGNPAVAYLVGVGAAAAVGGALTGTLFPQVWASINMFDQGQIFQGSIISQILKASLILLGTIATLAYFHYGASSKAAPRPQRAGWIESLSRLGQIFIAITFGALFAGVYAAALTAFIERLHFIRDILFQFL